MTTVQDSLDDGHILMVEAVSRKKLEFILDRIPETALLVRRDDMDAVLKVPAGYLEDVAEIIGLNFKEVSHV